MSNPTPTTLREWLEKLYDKPAISEDMYNENLDQATQSIKEQLKALLPKKREYEMFGQSYACEEYVKSFNQAIDLMDKAIEEWAK